MNILLAPNGPTKLIQVRLPGPKENDLQLFLYDEDNIALYEITKYYDPHRSWFLDNSFCRDGHLNLLTKFDPLYIFIPQLIKYASEQFRTLHDICSTYNASISTDSASKIDFALSPDIKWELVCDTKELNDEIFVKFSRSKTMDWLQLKHKKLVGALSGVLPGQPSTATLISHAFDLIGLYLPQSLNNELKDLVRSKHGKPVASMTPKNLPKSTASTADKRKDPPKGSVLHLFKRKN